MAIPEQQIERRPRRLCVTHTFDAQQIEALDRLARERGVPRSLIVRAALDRELRRARTEQPRR